MSEDGTPRADYPCTRCSGPVGQDSLDTAAQLARRAGKEPTQPKLCLPCLWDRLRSMSTEEEKDDGQEG